MKHKIEFLGHIISDKGIKVNAKKIDSIKAWKPPCNVTQVESFLSLNDAAERFFDDNQYAANIANSSIQSSNVANSDNANEHRRQVVHAFGD